MNFLFSFATIGMIIAMAIPGFIVRKLNMVPKAAIGGLVIVLMYINQPFLTIASFAKKDFEMRLLVNMGWTVLFSIVLQLIIFFIAKLSFSPVKDAPAKKILTITSYMSNCGFMGIPLLQGLYPELPELIIYAAVFLVVFNIFSWTLSVFAITGEKKYISLTKAFLNPPTAALIIALPLFFTGFKLPVPVMNSVNLLGDMTLPLSMIIIGMRLADMRIATIFNSLKVYIAVFIRLILSPLLTLGVLLLLRLFMSVDPMVITAMYIIMAMPTATASVMFAEMYNGDSATGSKVVFMSSILCVVTLPLLILLIPFI